MLHTRIAGPLGAAVLALTCGAASAAGSQGPLSPLPPIVMDSAALDDLSPDAEAAIDAMLQQAEKQLREEGKLPVGAKVPSSIGYPMATLPGIGVSPHHVVTNFVDHNPAFRQTGTSTVLDYACGTRTYDLEDYNHRGTDYVLYPFSWQTMAQEQVAGVAAAPGTILAKSDGNPDRNCSFNSPDTPNAVFILHADGTVGWYLHFKKGTVTTKAVGESVAAGEYLGMVGSSGISTIPHLHFELRGGTSPTSAVIDPYIGQCNAGLPIFAQQESYRTPRVLALTVHSGPAEPGAGCGAVEQPKYRSTFAPGQSAIFYAWFRDLAPNKIMRWRLYRPDGTLEADLSELPDTGGQFLSAGAWGRQFVTTANTSPGTWTIQLDYDGQTKRAKFHVGGATLAATGAWYDPTQSGHGLMMEVIESNGANPTLVATWYAFLDGQPEWLIGTGPIGANGEAKVAMLRATGSTAFPPGFNRDNASLAPWGELTVKLDSASAGNISWTTTTPGFSNGSMPITRLVGPADINKDNFDSGTRACMTGNWYNTSQSGHGLVVEVVGEGASQIAVATWYVYHQGRPYWLVGNGPIVDGRANLTLFETSGGDFPPDFDPSAIQQRVWGTAQFDFQSPSSARIAWTPQLPGFEAGSLALSRLTGTVQTPCL